MPGSGDHSAQLDRYRATRATTRELCAPLEVEDCIVQSMPDVSPIKWHLAHTSWFFECFVLCRQASGYREYHPRFHYLFNSYYETAGPMHARSRRGLLSRPTLAEVWRYREHVDAIVERLLERDALDAGLREIVEIGLHHEQQHQELMLTDIQHVFWCNPLHPAYGGAGHTGYTAMQAEGSEAPAAPHRWHPYPGGVCEVGANAAGFCFDNERPRHRRFLEPFALGSRLITQAEFLEFMEDGGYRRPELWLADGWRIVCQEGWQAPLYWLRREERWEVFSLWGLRPMNRAAPVAHISYYEADAFARWYGARLPTEAEWEVVAARQPGTGGNFLESGLLRPRRAESGDARLEQLFGDVWEWTSSHYEPYPGFCPWPGSLGEYSGKFMCGQQILRGGSCATPRTHIRASYRNFFPPAARWQFSGLRLARDTAGGGRGKRAEGYSCPRIG